MADGIYYNPEPQLTVDTVSLDNQTISGNSYDNFSIATTKSGYTAIGVVGWEIQNATSSGTNATNCTLYRYYKSSAGNATFYVKNNGSSSAKIRMVAYVLYRKN